MKVYKFGGASVKSADGVRNLKHIVEDEKGSLFIIVSAMGKTTNALESVVDHFMAGRTEEALREFSGIEEYHNGIMNDLFNGEGAPLAVQKLYDEARRTIGSVKPAESDFEKWYDGLVSYGELISTSIISAYLNNTGVRNKWVDMRRCFITDSRFKYANVDIETSTVLLGKEVSESDDNIFVGQGFIGATIGGATTTLGREGSDYSAAVTASILDAESVSIWKDVIGVLNADPKIFPESTFIPELTYLDAIELAFSGAQIIHPKTIKPLQNKNIPLYVRPFGNKSATGSVIKSGISKPVDIPILILKRDQVLMSIRPQDYSFVLEDKLGEIFGILESHNIKVNLVQTSAVCMSLSVDRSRRLDDLVGTLESSGFFVNFDEGMELLTIRGYNTENLEKFSRTENVCLAQRTKTILRVVRRETS